MGGQRTCPDDGQEPSPAAAGPGGRRAIRGLRRRQQGCRGQTAREAARRRDRAASRRTRWTQRAPGARRPGGRGPRRGPPRVPPPPPGPAPPGARANAASAPHGYYRRPPASSSPAAAAGRRPGAAVRAGAARLPAPPTARGRQAPYGGRRIRGYRRLPGRARLSAWGPRARPTAWARRGLVLGHASSAVAFCLWPVAIVLGDPRR